MADLGAARFGFIAFLIQQMSLATGQLAPAMAAVSVANPAVSVILGMLLFQERLPPRVACRGRRAALLAALGGAVLITLANRETAMPGSSRRARRNSRRPGAGLILEIFVLALASTIRPTSLAAVYALVSHDGRRRLMWVYVVAGLVFTVAFGALIVGATHGIHLGSGHEQDEGHRRHRRRRGGAGVRRRAAHRPCRRRRRG